MKERAGRLFNVYSSEWKQAWLFSTLAFVLSLACSLGYKMSDALFLLHLSADRLPLAYGCISCCLIGLAIVIIYSLNRHSPSTIFKRILFIGTAFYASVTLGLFYDLETISPWSWFFLKVCNHIFFIEVISCFWTFLDQYYHFQDAKRLYTLFNSSIYLGLACTGMLINSGALEVFQIYGLVFFLCLIVYLLFNKITRTYDVVPDDAEIEAMAANEDRSLKLKTFFGSFFKSRFTLFLMLGNLILYLLMTTTEYGYFSAFQQSFSSNVNVPVNGESALALPRFMGSCLAIVGIGNLIIGWFFYSRLVLRFGVINLILLTPIGFAVTYAGWPFDSTLLFPLIGFFVVEGIYPVIEDNNFNLLLNGVPLRLKAKVRVMIESFSEPVGMLLFSVVFYCTQINIKHFGLLLAICSVVVALIIRAHYFKAIFINLKDHALCVHKKARDFLLGQSKKGLKLTEQQLLSFLQHPDEALQKQSLEALFALGNVQLLRKALGYNQAFSTAARIYFLSLVEKSPWKNELFVIDTLNRWKEETPNIELQGAIDFYLAKMGLLPQEKVIYSLESRHLLQRGAALIALKRSSEKEEALQEIEKLLISTKEDELQLGITLLGIDGGQENTEKLMSFLAHPSLKIAKSAAKALQEVLGSNGLPYVNDLLSIISARSDSEFRLLCFQALGKIGDTSVIRPMITISSLLRPNEARELEKIICDFGPKAVDVVVELLCDTTLSDRSRIVAGKILSQLSLQKLSEHLFEVIRYEIERAYFYFYYGKTLTLEDQSHDITLLKEGLLSSFQSVIDFIIQLLGASKWIEDCELIVFSLRNKSPKIRSQAIETLEMCCDRKVFRLLYPLVADLPLKEKLRFCLKYAKTDLDITQVLEKMETTPNTLDKILAATWKYRLQLPNWRSSLQKYYASKEDVPYNLAFENKAL